MTSETTSVMDWAELLGRLHPVLVHVPIGLVFGVLLIELFGFGEVPGRFVVLRRAALVVCALAAGVTAASGWFLAQPGGYDADILGWHRWLSVAFAGVLGLAALADLFGSSGLWRRSAVLLAVALVVVTGHQGGSLTHGTTYLTRGAPAWMQKAVEAISPLSYRGREDTEVAGGDAEAGGADEAPEAEREGIASSDASRVRDVFERRCIKCHGPEKSKAGLRLDEREGVLSVVDPGAAPDSELYRRVTLPEGHGDEMPTEGPRLADSEIASLRRWINAGAPALEPPVAPEGGEAEPGESGAPADAEPGEAPAAAPESPDEG